MKKLTMHSLALAALLLALGAGSYAIAGGTEDRDIRETLIGYEEVPSVSTVATGRFTARVRNNRIEFTLSYRRLEGDVQQAHIHLGQRHVNGGISVFLCSNLPNPPAGTQPCPAPPATITGTLMPDDVIGPAAQGIAPGEFGELVAAIRAGATYANVHSSKFPGGEIRAQLLDDRKGRNKDKDEGEDEGEDENEDENEDED
jgi:CHRD domain